MFIDAYAANWFDELHARAEKLSSAHHLYLLVDGAFVPGLHKLLGEECKALLFEALPGFNEAAKDVSPFLVPFDLADKDQASLLRRCSRWPMVSLIETSEALEKLRDRLAAWCVVEVDGPALQFQVSGYPAAQGDLASAASGTAGTADRAGGVLLLRGARWHLG
jgi:hypothetical protein